MDSLFYAVDFTGSNELDEIEFDYFIKQFGKCCPVTENDNYKKTDKKGHLIITQDLFNDFKNELN